MGDLEDIADPEVAAVSSRCPELPIDPRELREALDHAAAARGGRPLDTDDAVVLALALGCAKGDRLAMDAFEGRYFDAARRAAAAIVGASEVDEVLQQLRERLFVPPVDSSARVIQAVGRGDMAKFVRVAAIRLALNARRDDERRRRRDHAGGDALAYATALDDPELRFAKASVIEVVKASFEEAVASLTARERNLLRHHLVDHLSIDQLAARYGVHRATAARWLAAARTEVAERTRELVRAKVGEQASARDLVELVDSRLNLSITRVLGDAPP